MNKLQAAVQKYIDFVKNPTGDHRDFDYTVDELHDKVFIAAIEQEHGADIWKQLVLMPI